MSQTTLSTYLPSSKQKNARSAFTLIELSIVLVIIGLIIGGILMGREMIRSAELRTIVTAAEACSTTANTFKLKYNCLPGDCASAGALLAGTNGNGDGIINSAGSNNNRLERFYFWQHLSLAGLVAETYSGTAGGTYYYTPGVNVPTGKIQNSAIVIGTMNQWGSAGGWFDATSGDYYTHRMSYGLPTRSTTAYDVQVGFMTPTEARAFDTKYDDGDSRLGRISWLSNSYDENNGYIEQCRQSTGEWRPHSLTVCRPSIITPF